MSKLRKNPIGTVSNVFKMVGYIGPSENEDNLWRTLLPRARQRLIDKGLFTPQGALTDQGRQALADGTWESCIRS